MTWVRDVFDAPPVLRGALVAVLVVMFLMVARERAHHHVASALSIQAEAHAAHVNYLRERVTDLEVELEECDERTRVAEE